MATQLEIGTRIKIKIGEYRGMSGRICGLPTGKSTEYHVLIENGRKKQPLLLVKRSLLQVVS